MLAPVTCDDQGWTDRAILQAQVFSIVGDRLVMVPVRIYLWALCSEQ